MRALNTMTLAAALTLVSGLAMAQTYGPTDPWFADTTDPGSVPTQSHRGYPHAGYPSYGGYAPGYYDYGYSRPYHGDWRSSGYYGW